MNLISFLSLYDDVLLGLLTGLSGGFGIYMLYKWVERQKTDYQKKLNVISKWSTFVSEIIVFIEIDSPGFHDRFCDNLESKRKDINTKEKVQNLLSDANHELREYYDEKLKYILRFKGVFIVELIDAFKKDRDIFIKAVSTISLYEKLLEESRDILVGKSAKKETEPALLKKLGKDYNEVFDYLLLRLTNNHRRALKKQKRRKGKMELATGKDPIIEKKSE